jgi:hypothetical protein
MCAITTVTIISPPPTLSANARFPSLPAQVIQNKTEKPKAEKRSKTGRRRQRISRVENGAPTRPPPLTANAPCAGHYEALHRSP